MEIKSFCKNQREVAMTINDVIDSYWETRITEKEMIILIERLYYNNMNKVIKDGKFTKILQQQCGKKRLDVISKLIKEK